MSLVLLALLAGVALQAAAADDEEVVIEQEIKIAIADGGDTEVFRIDDDLEVGESRQFFTESGKEIVILRTDEGFDVTVDGESIDTGVPGAGGVQKIKIVHLETEGDGGEHVVHSSDGATVKVIRLGDGEGDLDIDVEIDGEGSHGATRVIRIEGDSAHVVKHRVHDGESHGAVFITTGGEGEESEHVWISADGAHAQAYTFGDGENLVEQLESSGALDALDAETREEVLEALRAAEQTTQDP